MKYSQEYSVQRHTEHKGRTQKKIKHVANVARRDVSEFLELAAEIPTEPEYQKYALEDANTALLELKERTIRGAKVLRV